MSKEEKRKTLQQIIWINLIICIYNLFVFTNIGSYFHLIIGTLNIGVWAFFRKPETLISLNGNDIEKKKNN